MNVVVSLVILVVTTGIAIFAFRVGRREWPKIRNEAQHRSTRERRLSILRIAVLTIVGIVLLSSFSVSVDENVAAIARLALLLGLVLVGYTLLRGRHR